MQAVGNKTVRRLPEQAVGTYVNVGKRREGYGNRLPSYPPRRRAEQIATSALPHRAQHWVQCNLPKHAPLLMHVLSHERRWANCKDCKFALWDHHSDICRGFALSLSRKHRV